MPASRPPAVVADIGDSIPGGFGSAEWKAIGDFVNGGYCDRSWQQ